MESNLVTPSGKRLDAGSRWSRMGCRLWDSLSLLPVGRRYLVYCDSGGPGSPFRAADDSQVFSMGAVIDPPAIGVTLSHGKFCAFAAYVIQPNHTFRGKAEGSWSVGKNSGNTGEALGGTYLVPGQTWRCAPR